MYFLVHSNLWTPEEYCAKGLANPSEKFYIFELQIKKYSQISELQNNINILSVTVNYTHYLYFLTYYLIRDLDYYT